MRRACMLGRLTRRMDFRPTYLWRHARGTLLLWALMLCFGPAATAQISAGGRFDLTGPRIDVHVQRGEKSLPIAMVPNLMSGDRLTIHADLPPTQSVKLMMVVAFLRGSINPPPGDWFTRINTWDKKVRSEGVTVVVPDEAQQAMIFVAPATGGGFATLKSAVTGRPGVFVRAAQDLNEASFEQERIERYLQAIRRVPPGSSAELLDHSHKLAATLNLKPNEDCFKKPADQQLTCLRQSGTQVLLDDGHGQTLASMITSGDSANLIGAIAGTPMANAGGAGSYSAYVGTIIDVVRLLSGLHTAQFQYIPAIAFPDGETLNSRLNTPPSFHNPKSVIAVALPAIQASVAPPLRLRDPGHVSCLLQPKMVLPLEGAPLVFATNFAHDLVLHLNGGTLGGKTDLPLVPDAYDGGLVLTSKTDRKALPVAAPEARDAKADVAPFDGKTADPPAEHLQPLPSDTGEVLITGTLHGAWGFDTFEGVTVPLQRKAGTGWTAVQHSDLLAGRENELTLRADGTACAAKIDIDGPGMQDVPLTWRQAAGAGPQTARVLDVKLPLEKAAPGELDVLVHQYGTDTVAKVAVRAYSGRTKPQALHLHSGDRFASLTGNGLDEIHAVRIAGVEYTPTANQPDGGKELLLASAAPPKENAASHVNAGATGTAEAVLQDGRTLPVTYVVDAPRPSLMILSKSVQPETPGALPLTLSSKDDLPLNARIAIALRSISPSRFPRSEKVEIALADGSLHTTVSTGDGSLVLQDAQTALAFILPEKAFGVSAFGPLQLRAVAENGTVGDWMPLGTLVRMPAISAFTCGKPAPHASGPANAGESAPAQTDSGCTLTGSNLFLVDSIAGESTFATPQSVPLGFAAGTIAVPRPADNHTLYLKLRDDPSAIVTLTLPLPPLNTARDEAVGASSTPVPAAAR